MRALLDKITRDVKNGDGRTLTSFPGPSPLLKWRGGRRNPLDKAAIIHQESGVLFSDWQP